MLIRPATADDGPRFLELVRGLAEYEKLPGPDPAAEQRLLADAPNRIATYSVEMEMIEKLKRIYYFAKRMAKSAVDDEPQIVPQAV